MWAFGGSLPFSLKRAARAEFILMDKFIHLMNLGSAVEQAARDYRPLIKAKDI